MPGVLNKKKEAGITFPPDWREIGYTDTPESTLEGFDYAKEIDANWDTSVHTYTEAFKDDYKLMYFPNMSYAKRYSMERCSRMFQNSNLEYFNSGLPYVQELASTFASCRNLRYCKITDLENTGINSISGLFTDCYQLERVEIDFDTLPSAVTNMSNLFSGCWNLKEISINNPNIINASGAFQNTYMLNEANITLNKCNDCSFYASGKNTDNGLFINLNMGANATQGTHLTLSKAKIKAGTSEIKVYNCNNLQSCFEETIFTNTMTSNKLYFSARSGELINCSFMFKNAICNAIQFPSPTITAAGNCISIFEGATCNAPGPDYYLNLTDIDFSSATSLKWAFKNSNINKINFQNANFNMITTFEDMFAGHNTLDLTSLNQLLLALTTATSYAGTKTLVALGFTSTYYPAADIQALSNYSAFTSAGWSIGY